MDSETNGTQVATIDSLDALRQLYPPAKGRAVTKQLDHLDPHCIRFITLSPFVVLASTGAGGAMDASPRGGQPGFIKVSDAHTLLIPDSKGNNRLDTLENLLATGRIGLLFLIPGIDETLRINGSARLVNAAAYPQFELSDVSGRPPKLAIEVTVAEAYLHCAKALMRSALWDPSRHVARSVLPTTSQMINEQSGIAGPAETHEAMVARYKSDL